MSAPDSPALECLTVGFQLVLDGLKRIRASEDWVDQYHSPLGKRAHLAAVRRGDLAGHRVEGSRAVLVRREDLDRYIQAHPVKPRDVPAAEDTRSLEEIAAAALAHRAPRRRGMAP